MGSMKDEKPFSTAVCLRRSGFSEVILNFSCEIVEKVG